MNQEEKIKIILNKLDIMYPDAVCELVFTTPFELLIATILSAQSTDRQVNKVTPPLFQACPTPEAFLKLSLEELGKAIKSLGLYQTKGKNILLTCKILVEDFGGKVPQERESLESLPGVGRKTANVVLSNAFNIPALAVDTHVFRVANRLGLASGNNVRKVEDQLTSIIPEEEWTKRHHQLIWHGRRLCTARNPSCLKCSLRTECTYFNETKTGEVLS